MEYLILVLIGLLFLLSGMCDTPSSISGYETIEAEEPEETKLLIFYAPWCGHCRRSMPSFTEATNKTNGKILLLNTDEEKNKTLAKSYNVNGYPTIISSDGVKHTGPRDTETLVNLANSL